MQMYNRGIRNLEGKKTSVQCPSGKKQFNAKIATEMDKVYDTTADGFSHHEKIANMELL